MCGLILRKSPGKKCRFLPEHRVCSIPLLRHIAACMSKVTKGGANCVKDPETEDNGKRLFPPKSHAIMLYVILE